MFFCYAKISLYKIESGLMNLKFVDMENWNRKNHYNLFKGFDYPHFNICANIDITTLRRFVKENNISFFISFLYAVTKTTNSIKEFRYRIREDKVIEHDNVHPSFTIMTNTGVFSFCPVNYVDNFKDFNKNTLAAMEKYKNSVNLEDEPGRDDLIFTTSIPWISFTSVNHPINMSPVDSIPRIAWGKYFEENRRIRIPLSVQAHHALVDGVHVGEYFNLLQEILDNPEKL